MTILFVFTSSGCGGAELSMLRLLARMIRLGLDARVFLMENNTPFSLLLAQENIPFDQLNSLSPLKYFSKLKSVRPHVVYFFGPVRSLPYVVVTKVMTNCITIGSERSSASRFLDRLSRLIDRFFIDAYISNSKIGARNLVDIHNVNPSHVYTIFNGLDGEHTNSSQIDKLQYPIVCVANINVNKGHIYLLRAVKILREKFADLKVLLIGSDHTDGAFFKSANDEGLTDTYYWYGFVNAPFSIVEGCRVACLTSIFREGIPTSLLEAMKSDIAVVASDIGGVPDLVISGFNGLLVRPCSVEDLVKTIGNLLTDELYRQQLVKNARVHTLPLFSLDSMMNSHLTVFKTYLNDQSL